MTALLTVADVAERLRVSVRTIQRLRHSSIVMTQRYAHLAPTSARNAVAQLAGVNLATVAGSER